jgi:hypothetical protein
MAREFFLSGANDSAAALSSHADAYNTAILDFRKTDPAIPIMIGASDYGIPLKRYWR